MKAIPAKHVTEGMLIMDEDGDMCEVREVDVHHKKPRIAVQFEDGGNWQNYDFAECVFVADK